MAMLTFSVSTDGSESVSEIDVSFDAARFSLQEMVRVEEVIGADRAALFIDGSLPFTPKALQAILWAKLATQNPEIGLSDFDLPGESFSAFGAETE